MIKLNSLYGYKVIKPEAEDKEFLKKLEYLKFETKKTLFQKYKKPLLCGLFVAMAYNAGLPTYTTIGLCWVFGLILYSKD